MTFENLADLADIVGVIVVIASLIYVARELRQNTEMIRAESRNEIVHGHVQEILATLDYPDVLRALFETEMDDSVVRVHSWLTAHCRSREHEWFQFRSGALDRSSWESYSSSIPIVLSGAKARAWWGHMKSAFDEGFVVHVDELLEKSPLSKQHRELGLSIRGALSRGSVEGQAV